MRKDLNRYFYLGLFILLSSLLLSACGSDRIRSPKPSSDWSRGLRVGVSANLIEPSLVVEENGDVLIAWTAGTSSTSGELGFARISDHGQDLAQSLITVQETHLRGGTLRETASGLEICWISDLGLRCSPIDPQAPTDLSPYTLIDPSEDLEAFDSSASGYAWLTRTGEVWLKLPGMEPERVADDSISISLQRSGGSWLLTWAEEESERETRIWLQMIPDEAPSERILVTRVPAGVSANLLQEGLGAVLTGDRVCVVFGVEFTGGTMVGTAFTELNCFSLNTSELVFSTRPSFIIADQLIYQDFEGAFGLDRLAPFEGYYPGLTYLPSEPIFDDGMLTFALSTAEQVRYQTQQQIAQVIIEDDQMLGYQPVSSTISWSINPQLALGPDGYLHIVWLESTGTRSVYYATTDPETAKQLNPIEPAEVSTIALGIITDAISGLFLVPLGLIWVGIGFIGLFAGTYIVRLFAKNIWADRIGFVVGVVLLWLSKLLFVPQIPTFIPFSDWFPGIPSSWFGAYQIFWPVAILTLSIFFSTRIVRRRDIESMATHFLIYSLFDIVLTALVYGVVLQGAV